jgi:hypothetical protein
LTPKIIHPIVIIGTLLFTSCNNKQVDEDIEPKGGLSESVILTNQVINTNAEFKSKIDSISKEIHKTDELLKSFDAKPKIEDTTDYLDQFESINNYKVMIASYDTTIIIDPHSAVTKDSLRDLLEAYSK